MKTNYPFLSDEESSLAAGANIGKDLTESIDSIDAAVFSGDTFSDKASIFMLIGNINRWGRTLISNLADLADAESYADGSFLKATATPVEGGLNLTLPFISIESEPEDYGDYTVMVTNRDGTFVVTDATFCHPPGALKSGWFVLRQGVYQHLLNVAYYADTKAIQLDSKPTSPKPF